MHAFVYVCMYVCMYMHVFMLRSNELLIMCILAKLLWNRMMWMNQRIRMFEIMQHMTDSRRLLYLQCTKKEYNSRTK